jgi:hypothetical protein
MADGNNLLNNKTFGILVVLRMNRTCMVCMRMNGFLEIKTMQPFNIAVLAPDLEEAKGGS